VTCKACGEKANAARRRRRARLATSAVEQARAFGIDLTLLASNLRDSPEERLAHAERSLRMSRLLKEVREARAS